MLRSFVLSLVALLALAGTAGAQGDPIMPLDQVSAGMRCTAFTVIRGTDVTTFDVEVLDVIAGDPAAESPRILFRASGPAVAGTGVGQGFSGSPIYCADGEGTQRVIGAISEGVADYGNDVGLATPIESILGVPVDPPSGTRSDPAMMRRARPLSAPLSFTGLSAPVAGLVRRAAAKAKASVFVTPGRPRAASFPVQTLRPGSAFAAGLASGDISLGAIGTVTYVDGDKLWGFGHPLDGAGRRALFLEDAYVYTVVGNPVGSSDLTTYKLAAAGHDVGTLTSDGVSGVAGRVGPLPERFPLTVTARDEDTGKVDVSATQVADETAIGLPTGTSSLAVAAPVAIAQAAENVLGSAPARQSGSMCLRIQVRERPKPMRFCNTYVGGAGGGTDNIAGAPMVADTASAVAALDAFNFGPLHVTEVSANIRLRRGLHQAFFVGATGPARVRRGQTISVRARIRNVNGPAATRVIRVHVPRGMPSGLRRLRLSGTAADASQSASDELAIVFQDDPTAGDGAGPRTSAALSRSIAALHRFDGVTASFQPYGSSGSDPLSDPATPHGAEGVARAEREVFRDPKLRLSGSASLTVDVS